MKWLVLVLAIAAIGFLVYLGVRPGDDTKLKTAQHTADSLLREAPKWTQERADSQRVLDSLTRLAEVSRKHLAFLEDSALRVKHHRDSLATQSRELSASLDTAQSAPVGPTASDTAARAILIAQRQGRLILSMREEIAGCEQGDGLWERRQAEWKIQLDNCEHRVKTLGQQLGSNQAHLDKTLATLDTLRQAEKAEKCHLVGIGIPCAEVSVFGGLTFTGKPVVAVGLSIPIKRIRPKL